MKRKTVVIATIIMLTGCAGNAHVGQHFTMSGTPDGIRAFGDTLVGALKTAKEKPEARNQYFASRADYERNVTEREKQPGFVQKLFGTQEAESQANGS